MDVRKYFLLDHCRLVRPPALGKPEKLETIFGVEVI